MMGLKVAGGRDGLKLDSLEKTSGEKNDQMAC